MTILFFCYRLVDFRMFVDTGILHRVSKKSSVVLLVPQRYVEDISKLTPPSVVVSPIRYEYMKGQRTTFALKDWATNHLAQIFALTFARKQNSFTCKSQKFIIEAFLRRRRRMGFVRSLAGAITVSIATIASRSKLARNFLQSTYAWVASSTAHEAWFQKFKPNLVVVGSMGVDADGKFLLESRLNKTRSVVMTQTWDRSSCKGFPTVFPDNVIAWSPVMADEFYHFQDMPRSKIHIEGAPVWDHLFNREQEMDKKEFLDSLGLSDKLPTAYFLYVPNSGMPITSKLLSACLMKKQATAGSPIHLPTSSLPVDETKRNEIISVFDQNQSLGGVYLDQSDFLKKY